jgi:hypothetical protein
MPRRVLRDVHHEVSGARARRMTHRRHGFGVRVDRGDGVSSMVKACSPTVLPDEFGNPQQFRH